MSGDVKGGYRISGSAPGLWYVNHQGELIKLWYGGDTLVPGVPTMLSPDREMLIALLKWVSRRLAEQERS